MSKWIFDVILFYYLFCCARVVILNKSNLSILLKIKNTKKGLIPSSSFIFYLHDLKGNKI